jgi:hypothetical protein
MMKALSDLPREGIQTRNKRTKRDRREEKEWDRKKTRECLTVVGLLL